MIIITKSPAYIESSKRNIESQLVFSSTDEDETVPAKGYIEIYTIPTKNVTESAEKIGFTKRDLLQKPFIDNVATFNLGNALHSLFTKVNKPTLDQRVQKDESSYFGYFLNYGYITYNSRNEQVLNYVSQTSVRWCYNSAFENDDNLEDWFPNVQDSNTGKFLTNIPDNSRRVHINEDVLLNAFLPKDFEDIDEEKAIFVKGDFYFSDNTSLLNQTIQSFTHRSGGNYIFNFKPSLSYLGGLKPISTLSKYSVWLEYLNGSDSAEVIGEVANYTATANYTANCQLGTTGTPVTRTATVTSELNQLDADSKAYAKAKQLAEADLVCSILYSSTKTYTAYCTGNLVGSYTATATATSTVSQGAADTAALNSAIHQANQYLRCTPKLTTYLATATYTATCPSGTTGTPYTVTVSRSSTISQADAQQQANQAAIREATDNLTCTVTVENEVWYCDYYSSNGCFSGQMISNLGNYRMATNEEGYGCWIDNGGQENCGMNPY